MYVSGFSPPPSYLYLSDQRGVFWVHICPAVRTQLTTPTRQHYQSVCAVSQKYH